MADFAGNSVAGLPANALGGGAVLLAGASLGAGSPAVTDHYALACFDNAGARHFWTDTSISLTNAPIGFTYVGSTLVVLRKY